MNQPIMTYDQTQGIKAGGGNFISEGGAYICTITEAKYVEAKTKTSGLEFSFESSDGQKINFINVYYAKQNGEKVTGGVSILNAMMGLCGISQMTSSQNINGFICPELTGKKIGVFLQKTIYSKGDGSDGYKFDIRVPYDINTGKTLREKVSNDSARTIESLSFTYKDKDERTAHAMQSSSMASDSYSNQQSQDDSYIPGFDD